MTTPFFEDFWQASCLSPYNMAEFVRKVNAYDPEGKQLRLEYSTASQPLPHSRRTRLERAAARRHSGREFASRALSLPQFGRLLGSCRAWGGAEHRGYPSAGASYAVEIFAVAWRVTGYDGRCVYYDPIDHGLVALPAPAPPWREAAERINAPVTGEPACMVIATVFADRLTDKYDERGGRFALLEAGATMQQLSLTAVDLGLAGVVAGGLMDRYWLHRLGLGRTSARIAFGYLAGHPRKNPTVP